MRSDKERHADDIRLAAQMLDTARDRQIRGLEPRPALLRFTDALRRIADGMEVEGKREADGPDSTEVFGQSETTKRLYHGVGDSSLTDAGRFHYYGIERDPVLEQEEREVKYMAREDRS